MLVVLDTFQLRLVVMCDLLLSPVTEAPEPVQTGGVYRPPGAREGGRPRRAQQGPPEIYSDTQFPSLQSTAKLVDSRK